MHVVMVIGGGVVLLGVFLLFGKLWGVPQPDLSTAAKLFLPVWLVVSLANMAVGVTRAGYTVAQELPILLVVFVVPALLALGGSGTRPVRSLISRRPIVPNVSEH